MKEECTSPQKHFLVIVSAFFFETACAVSIYMICVFVRSKLLAIPKYLRVNFDVFLDFESLRSNRFKADREVVFFKLLLLFD